MRRFLPLAAVLVPVALLLSACGGGDDPTIPAASDTSTAHGAMTESSGNSGMDMGGMKMGDDDTAMSDGHGEASEARAGAREVPVTATSFRFEPAEIRARVGENLAIVLTATDILHDFTIDELGAHVAADRGQTATGGVTATKPGRYTYYCTVAGHRQAGMQGTLIVE